MYLQTFPSRLMSRYVHACVCLGRREEKYREKMALKKAQRRAAETDADREARKKAKLDTTAAHFG